MSRDAVREFSPLLSLRRRPPRRSARSGWQIGVAVGVLIGLFAFPAVRGILLAQIQFTLVQESTPWLRAMDSRRMRREMPRLDVAAATFSNDYLVQVGRATLAADPALRLRHADGDEDRSLERLAVVAKNFPAVTGIYAHLTRNMLRERIRIFTVHTAKRPSGYALHGRDVKLMEWALKRGEFGDPENAYWQAMTAVTAFANGDEKAGIHALSRTKGKLCWDAYLYEEVLGQWRLYAATYGDRGAMQKIGPLSLLSFPHLRELRNMAELARDAADNAEAWGDLTEAIRIRQSLWQLGLLMRDTAQWAYEALIGTEIFFVATTDAASKIPTGSLRNLEQWRSSAKGVLNLMHRARQGYKITALENDVTACGDLRNRIDIARYDAAYPGIPPGIPLRELFGSWMQGVCLAQQGLALLAAYGAFLLVRRVPAGRPRLWFRRLAFWSAGAAGGYAAINLIGGVPNPHLILLLMLSLTVWGLLTVRRWVHGEHSEILTPDQIAAVRWTPQTALRLSCCVFLPGLFALIALRPALTNLHPVAIMLTGVLDVQPVVHWDTVILQTLCAYVLPFLLVLVLIGWAVVRRVSPIAAIRFGLPRLFVPSLCVLLVSYLLVLNQTLQWDAEASQSINIAAQNDLNWVLTHSDPDDAQTE